MKLSSAHPRLHVQEWNLEPPASRQTSRVLRWLPTVCDFNNKNFAISTNTFKLMIIMWFQVTTELRRLQLNLCKHYSRAVICYWLFINISRYFIISCLLLTLTTYPVIAENVVSSESIDSGLSHDINHVLSNVTKVALRFLGPYLTCELSTDASVLIESCSLVSVYLN